MAVKNDPQLFAGIRFGENSNSFIANGQSLGTSVFGSRATSGVEQIALTPAEMQQGAAWRRGWGAATVVFSTGSDDTNNAVLIRDFNSVCVNTSALANNIQLYGIHPWLAGINYTAGSMVQDGNGNVFISKTNDNLDNNPTTDTTEVNWAVFKTGTDVSAMDLLLNSTGIVYAPVDDYEVTFNKTASTITISEIAHIFFGRELAENTTIKDAIVAVPEKTFTVNQASMPAKTGVEGSRPYLFFLCYNKAGDFVVVQSVVSTTQDLCVVAVFMATYVNGIPSLTEAAGFPLEIAYLAQSPWSQKLSSNRSSNFAVKPNNDLTIALDTSSLGYEGCNLKNSTDPVTVSSKTITATNTVSFTYVSPGMTTWAERKKLTTLQISDFATAANRKVTIPADVTKIRLLKPIGRTWYDLATERATILANFTYLDWTLINTSPALYVQGDNGFNWDAIKLSIDYVNETSFIEGTDATSLPFQLRAIKTEMTTANPPPPNPTTFIDPTSYYDGTAVIPIVERVHVYTVDEISAEATLLNLKVTIPSNITNVQVKNPQTNVWYQPSEFTTASNTLTYKDWDTIAKDLSGHVKGTNGFNWNALIPDTSYAPAVNFFQQELPNNSLKSIEQECSKALNISTPQVSIQRIYMLVDGSMVVQYGNKLYETIGSAVLGLSTDVNAPVIPLDFAIYVGAVVITSNATSLTTQSECVLILAGSAAVSGAETTPDHNRLTGLQLAVIDNNNTPDGNFFHLTQAGVDRINSIAGAALPSNQVMNTVNGFTTETTFVSMGTRAVLQKVGAGGKNVLGDVYAGSNGEFPFNDIGTLRIDPDNPLSWTPVLSSSLRLGKIKNTTGYFVPTVAVPVADIDPGAPLKGTTECLYTCSQTTRGTRWHFTNAYTGGKYTAYSNFDGDGKWTFASTPTEFLAGTRQTNLFTTLPIRQLFTLRNISGWTNRVNGVIHDGIAYVSGWMGSDITTQVTLNPVAVIFDFVADNAYFTPNPAYMRSFRNGQMYIGYKGTNGGEFVSSANWHSTYKPSVILPKYDSSEESVSSSALDVLFSGGRSGTSKQTAFRLAKDGKFYLISTLAWGGEQNISGQNLVTLKYVFFDFSYPVA